jgi:hypothetical protein
MHELTADSVAGLPEMTGVVAVFGLVPFQLARELEISSSPLRTSSP